MKLKASLVNLCILTLIGFIQQSLDFIRKRIRSSGYDRYYALSFDEIHIRQQVLFNGKKLVGFIEYGDIAKDINFDKEQQAKSALFIVATEINGNKRLPIGYILTAGLDAELMSTVIKSSLTKMSEAEARVLTITFDGLPANFAATEKLGAVLDISSDDIQPYIIHPETRSKVYIIPDVVHMFKLLRNAFKKCGRFMDMDGNVSQCSFQFYANLNNILFKR